MTFVCDSYMRHAFVKIETKLLLEIMSIKKFYFYTWSLNFIVEVNDAFH